MFLILLHLLCVFGQGFRHNSFPLVLDFSQPLERTTQTFENSSLNEVTLKRSYSYIYICLFVFTYNFCF